MCKFAGTGVSLLEQASLRVSLLGQASLRVSLLEQASLRVSLLEQASLRVSLLGQASLRVSLLEQASLRVSLAYCENCVCSVLTAARTSSFWDTSLLEHPVVRLLPQEDAKRGVLTYTDTSIHLQCAHIDIIIVANHPGMAGTVPMFW